MYTYNMKVPISIFIQNSFYNRQRPHTRKLGPICNAWYRFLYRKQAMNRTNKSQKLLLMTPL